MTCIYILDNFSRETRSSPVPESSRLSPPTRFWRRAIVHQSLPRSGATLIALLLVPAVYLLLGDAQAATAEEPASPLVSSILEAA